MLHVMLAAATAYWLVVTIVRCVLAARETCEVDVDIERWCGWGAEDI